MAREVRAESLAIPRSALAKGRVGVLGLVKPSIETNAKKRHWIESVLDKQKQFVFCFKSAKYSSWLVVGRVHRFAFQLAGKGSYDLRELTLIILPTHHGRRLHARDGRVSRRLLRNSFWLASRLVNNARKFLCRGGSAANEPGQEDQPDEDAK